MGSFIMQLEEWMSTDISMLQMQMTIEEIKSMDNRTQQQAQENLDNMIHYIIYV